MNITSFSAIPYIRDEFDIIQDSNNKERCRAGFQVAAHGTLGGVSTWARGGSFWSGFTSGAAWRCIAKRNNINLYKR